MSELSSVNGIILRSSDGEIITAPRSLRHDSQVLWQVFNDFPREVIQDEPISLNINAATLALLIGWYESRCHQKWEQENMPLDKESLFNLVIAANYLEINFLLQWSCNKVADMLSENSLHSLGGLPDEVQIIVANYLSPYALLKAAKTRIIPVTSDLEQRVQHTYAWASILNESDFAHLHNKFDGIGNALLIGYDLKRLYSGFFQPATDEPPIHLLLTWLPEEQGPVFKSNIITSNDLCDKKRIYKTFHVPRSKITLTIRQSNGVGVDLDDLGEFIHKDSLNTNMIYFKGDTSLHEITLNMDDHGPLHGTVYSIPLNTYIVNKHNYRNINLRFRVPREKGPRRRIPWHMR